MNLLESQRQRRRGFGHLFRKATFPAWKIWRRATAGLRVLPDFIIIGVQKGGTTSLYKYLAQHPDMVAPLKKEIKFFDTNYRLGLDWYRGHFPFRYKMRSPKARTGEASPNMIFFPDAPARIAAVLPKVKLIALLRDPMERAYSHHRMNLRTGRDELTFQEALDQENERLRGVLDGVLAGEPQAVYKYISFSYKAKGHYAEQLDHWYAHFPREQILVLKSEDLFANPRQVHQQVLEFLELEPHELEEYPAFNPGKYDSDLNTKTRNQLGEHFRPHNLRLYQMLGRDFGWQS